MQVLPEFPDIQAIAVALLTPLAPTVFARPSEITPPLIQVFRAGGGDDGLTDYPRLEVQTFGGSYTEGIKLAEGARQYILASEATQVSGCVIDWARTETGPVYVEYGDPGIDRYVASYTLALRRRF